MKLTIKGKDLEQVTELTNFLLNAPSNNVPDINMKEDIYSIKMSLKDLAPFIKNVLEIRAENENLKAHLNTLLGKKQDLEKNAKIIQMIGLMKDFEGINFSTIAKRLNEHGFTNSRNNKFTRLQVNRLYKKYKASLIE